MKKEFVRGKVFFCAFVLIFFVENKNTDFATLTMCSATLIISAVSQCPCGSFCGSTSTLDFHAMSWVSQTESLRFNSVHGIPMKKVHYPNMRNTGKQISEIFSVRILIPDILILLNRRNFWTIFPKYRAEISTIQEYQNVRNQNAHRKYLKYFGNLFAIISHIGVHIEYIPCIRFSGKPPTCK